MSKVLYLILIISNLFAETIIIEVNFLFKKINKEIPNVIINEVYDGFLYYINEDGSTSKINCNSVIAVLDNNGNKIDNICELEESIIEEHNFNNKKHQIFFGNTFSKLNSFHEFEDNTNVKGIRFGAERLINKYAKLSTGTTFTQRGYKYSSVVVGSNTKITYTQHINYFTIYSHYGIPIKNINSYLLFGTELGFFLESELLIQSCNNSIDMNGGDSDSDFNSNINCGKDKITFIPEDWVDLNGGMNLFDYGMLLGYRYELFSRINLNFMYYHGLRNLGKAFDGKNTSMNFFISYIL